MARLLFVTLGRGRCPSVGTLVAVSLVDWSKRGSDRRLLRLRRQMLLGRYRYRHHAFASDKAGRRALARRTVPWTT